MIPTTAAAKHERRIRARYYYLVDLFSGPGLNAQEAKELTALDKALDKIIKAELRRIDQEAQS